MKTKFKFRTKLLSSMVFVLLGFFSNTLQSQSIQDDAAIISACLNLQEVQAHLPQNVDNSYQQVRILQFPVEFEWDTQITKFGKPVLFQDRSEIFEASPSAYLNFISFSKDGANASVNLNLLYDLDSDKPQLLEAELQFKMVENDWKIITSTFKNQ